MNSDLRIVSHPILEVPSREKITFRFDNEDYHGFTGETVASALYANGIRIFSRSNKYHRPRGLFCLTGNCSHCLMRVNGIPNTRICREPVKEGLVVTSQNAWPSLKHDILSLSTFFSPWLKPGFYYRYFKRPRWAYLIWENALRKVAGIGEIASGDLVPRPVRKTASPKIVVIGGGISGMQAGLTAAESVKTVWLIERERRLGGQSLWDTSEIQVEGSSVTRTDELVRELTAKVLANPQIKILHGATAISWHTEENTMIVTQPETYWEMQPTKTILATGAYETPFLFGNSDLPGVFLGTGLQQLMHRDFVKPGNNAVVVTESARGYRLAHQLQQSGVNITTILDLRKTDQCGPEVQECKQNLSCKVFCGVKIDKAIGRKEVQGITFSQTTTGEKTTLKCDVIALAGPRIPANELAFQKSAEGTFLLESEFKLTRKVSTKNEVRVDNDMFIVGEANGCKDPSDKIVQGQLAGKLASQEAGEV